MKRKSLTKRSCKCIGVIAVTVIIMGAGVQLNDLYCNCPPTFLSDVSQVLANVAAIIGVIFLVYQVIGLKKTLKVDAYKNRYSMYMEMDKMIVENPEYKRLIATEAYNEKFPNDESELSDKDIAFIEMVMNICQVSFFQYQDDIDNSELTWFKELLENRYIIEYLESDYRCLYRKAFMDFIKEEYAKEKYTEKGLQVNIQKRPGE